MRIWILLDPYWSPIAGSIIQIHKIHGHGSEILVPFTFASVISRIKKKNAMKKSELLADEWGSLKGSAQHLVRIPDDGVSLNSCKLFFSFLTQSCVIYRSHSLGIPQSVSEDRSIGPFVHLCGKHTLFPAKKNSSKISLTPQIGTMLLCHRHRTQNLFWLLMNNPNRVSSTTFALTSAKICCPR